jgi:hypothetical protein
MKVDLHNFFKFYDEKNPNHVRAVQILEDTLPNTFMQDESEWVKVYRTRVEPPKSNILPNFPWFPQTDNFRDPQRTCNSSSCAMCLEYFKPGTLKGPKGDDDYIRKVFAVGDTTDHAVQTRVLQSYGVKSDFRYNLTFADLDRELSAGRPVCIGILHRGPLSAPTGGHVLVVIGKTPSGDYVVNDPFGSLNDNYTGPVTNGRGAVYKKSDLSRRWCPKGNDGWGRIFDPVKK